MTDRALPKRPTQPTRRGALGLALGLGAFLARPARAQAPIRFALDWRFEGPSAPFLLALDKGFCREEGVEVAFEAGNGSREAIARIASGQADAGFGDINTLIRHRDDNAGAELKAVMMVYDRPPFAIVGRKSRGIGADPRSLQGKKVGAPAGDAAFAQWPVFKAITAIDDSKMRFENVGFAVREPMLASGEVDAVFGYAHTAAVNLQARGVPGDDIVTLMMADHGLELYGNAIIVSAKLASERPEAVRGLLRALTRAIKEAAADPDAAIQPVLKRNELARPEIEHERLRMVLDGSVITPWTKANGLGGIDRPRFDRALDQLALAAPLRNRTRAAESFTDAFLPAASERVF